MLGYAVELTNMLNFKQISSMKIFKKPQEIRFAK
jgi:hypothetical protein